MRVLPLKVSLLSLAVAGLFASPGLATAQTTTTTPPAPAPTPAPDTTPPADGQASGLPDIIVTATKRSENLQRVPLAVTAISGDALSEQKVYNVQDLAQSQPSVNFTAFNAFDQQINIRGVVTVHLGDPTNEPSVGTFVDGVYVGGQGVAFNDYFDVERLEITRGPQGVLYGKNVAGGAISVTTAKPSFTPSGALEASYGNYNSALLGGYVTGPITENLAGRFAFQARYSDGYARNVLLDRRMNGIKSIQLRGSLLWRPTDDLDAQLTVNYGYETTNGSQHSADPDYRGLAIPGLLLSLPDGRASLGLGPRDSYNTTADYTRRESEGATLTVNWRVSPDAQITSISNYNSGKGTNLFDQIGLTSPPAILNSAIFQVFTPRGFSEDLRVASTNKESRFDYIVGAYLSHDVIGSPTSVTSASYLAALVPAFRALSGTAQYQERSRITDTAIYGQVGFKITPQLKFTVGARYTIDAKSGFKSAFCASDGQAPDDGQCTAPLQGLSTGQGFSGGFNHTWRAFTPQGILEWQITPSIMTYASVSKGFKGGGWDGLPATASVINAYFDPEHATSYEVGLKSELLSHHVRLNIALFDLEYKDLQVQETNSTCLCLVTSNAGGSRSRGVEVEAQIVPNDTIKFFGGASYIDGEYKEFVDAGVDLSGNKLQLTPDFKGSVGFSFTPNFGAQDRPIELRVNYTYQSKYYLDPQNDATQKAYGLLDAAIKLHLLRNALTLGLWGKNLTDKYYEAYGSVFLGDVVTVPAPPRTYGLEVKYKI